MSGPRVRPPRRFATPSNRRCVSILRVLLSSVVGILLKETNMRRAVLVSSFVLVAAAFVAAQTPAPKPAAPKPAAPAAPKPAAGPNRLLNPASLTAKAPETFKVKFDTSKG